MARRILWQLVGVWLAGSVPLGLLVTMLAYNRRYPLAQGVLVPETGNRQTTLLLLALVFAILLVVGWATSGACWLNGDFRAIVLWVVLVGGLGLLGWGFAATVTFGAGFTPDTQIILALVGSGLPFALVATTLLAPWKANIAGLLISAGMVSAGYLLVTLRTQLDVFQLYTDFLLRFVA